MADSDDKDNVVRKIPVPKADLQVNFTTWIAGKLICKYPLKTAHSLLEIFRHTDYVI
ncbi:hypothetical protein ACVSUJ_20980 [Yersinia enterocolitica]|nr:hypothetical protein [Yersinia enterocolitica]